MDALGWIIYGAIILAMLWYAYSHRNSDNSFQEIDPKQEYRLTRPMPQRKKQITDNMESKKGQTVESQTVTQTTRELLFDVLRKLNLDYKIDTDGDIQFTYHGEHFLIIAQDDAQYIQIRDLWWYEAPLEDIENLSILHRAVNLSNVNASNVFMYSNRKEDNTFNLHTLRSVLWIPEIPGLETYLIDILGDMLHAQRCFYQTLEDIRREEHANVRR